MRVVDVHAPEKQAKNTHTHAHKKTIFKTSLITFVSKDDKISGLNVAGSAIKTRSANRGTSLTTHREEEHQQPFTQV